MDRFKGMCRAHLMTGGIVFVKISIYDHVRKNLSPVQIMLFAIILIGVFARVYQFGNIPGDINNDEAFAGFEAYSLLTTGKDTHGYAFPVYLTAWGSGMSALNTYLMIPFIAVFGLHVWVIRLPQLIVGCLCIPVVYLVMKRTGKQSVSLFSTFLFAIAPWHIMLSRWGIDCNLAPGFLLFGLYFFLKGLEDSRFFILSACMYGFSLYSYATIWAIVPAIILLQILYCMFSKKLKMDCYLLISGFVLAILALPLLLFMLVNYGYIDEIRLHFLSIPKLLYMRDGDFSGYDTKGKIRTLFQILIRQYDGLPWNATEKFGLFYFCSFPFFLLGVILSIVKFVKGLLKREFFPLTLLLFWLGTGLYLGTMVEGNINRLNCLFIPMILFAGYGISILFQKIHTYLILLPVIVYSLLFMQFERFYFIDYQSEIAGSFYEGLEDAFERASENQRKMYISPYISWSTVLFYSSIDPDEYRNTVRYANYPDAYLSVTAFGRYELTVDTEILDPAATYILDDHFSLELFTDAGFQTEQYGLYTVAWHP